MDRDCEVNLLKRKSKGGGLKFPVTKIFRNSCLTINEGIK